MGMPLSQVWRTPPIATRCADADTILDQIGRNVLGCIDAQAYAVLPCTCGDPGGAGVSFRIRSEVVEIWLRSDDTYEVRVGGSTVGIAFCDNLTDIVLWGLGPQDPRA